MQLPVVSNDTRILSETLSNTAVQTSASVTEITANIRSIGSQFRDLSGNIASSSSSVEVRHLAGAVAVNSSELGTTLQNVIEKINRATQASSESSDVVERISVQVRDVVLVFGEITVNMQELNQGAGEVVKASTTLVDTIEEIRIILAGFDRVILVHRPAVYRSVRPIAAYEPRRRADSRLCNGCRNRYHRAASATNTTAARYRSK